MTSSEQDQINSILAALTSLADRIAILEARQSALSTRITRLEDEQP